MLCLRIPIGQDESRRGQAHRDRSKKNHRKRSSQKRERQGDKRTTKEPNEAFHVRTRDREALRGRDFRPSHPRPRGEKGGRKREEREETGEAEFLQTTEPKHGDKRKKRATENPIEQKPENAEEQQIRPVHTKRDRQTRRWPRRR